MDQLTSAPKRLDESVRRILSEVHGGIERREVKRFPFFRPVRIGLNRQPPSLPAIARDLSPQGIGLLHAMPLGCDEITVAVRSKSGEATTFRVRLDWCESFGEGWYISGGHFLDVVQCDRDGPALLEHTRSPFEVDLGQGRSAAQSAMPVQ